jgi:hypothetical protein
MFNKVRGGNTIQWNICLQLNYGLCSKIRYASMRGENLIDVFCPQFHA